MELTREVISMIYYAEFAILLTIDAYNKWKKFVEKSGIEPYYDLLNVDSGNVFLTPSGYIGVHFKDISWDEERFVDIRYLYRFLETIDEKEYKLLVVDKDELNYIEKGKLEDEVINKSAYIYIPIEEISKFLEEDKYYIFIDL
jgi:hypothetical protein